MRACLKTLVDEERDRERLREEPFPLPAAAELEPETSISVRTTFSRDGFETHEDRNLDDCGSETRASKTVSSVFMVVDAETSIWALKSPKDCAMPVSELEIPVSELETFLRQQITGHANLTPRLIL